MKKVFLLIGIIVFFANISFAQDDKTVTVTVSGQGKTQEEAKQSALRNAIEQAFGAFISSKTEILNDELVKDEIVSVSNGNIQKFEVISEIQIPDVGYATTLKAIVSVTKLTTFIESKGGELEFKGSLFSFNIKQQILNEKSEQKAILDLLNVIKKLIDRSFDYSINSGTPEAVKNNNENWNIPIIITVKTNDNFLNMYNYLVKTLKSISLSEIEVQDYKSLNKKVFNVEFQGAENLSIYLRTENSYQKVITELTTYFCKSMLSIKIVDNAGHYSFSPELNNSEFKSSFLPIAFTSKKASVPNQARNIFEVAKYLSSFISNYEYQSIQVAKNPGNGYGYTFDNKISLFKYSGGKETAIITINKKFTLDQINQLSGFKVTNN